MVLIKTFSNQQCKIVNVQSTNVLFYWSKSFKNYYTNKYRKKKSFFLLIIQNLLRLFEKTIIIKQKFNLKCYRLYVLFIKYWITIYNQNYNVSIKVRIFCILKVYFLRLLDSEQ